VQGKEIYFDFVNAAPTTLASYRGLYNELAIGYALTEDTPLSVKARDFLEDLKNSVGREFEGWKGGEYLMGLDTPVWVSNIGNVSSTAVTGVLNEPHRIIILTEYTRFFTE
jgi:hypothetical protein